MKQKQRRAETVGYIVVCEGAPLSWDNQHQRFYRAGVATLFHKRRNAWTHITRSAAHWMDSWGDEKNYRIVRVAASPPVRAGNGR